MKTKGKLILADTFRSLMDFIKANIYFILQQVFIHRSKNGVSFSEFLSLRTLINIIQVN